MGAANTGTRRQLEVVYQAAESLTPYPNNSRTHDEYQVKQLGDSMVEFGFTDPVLVDENNQVLAGHGRLMAADKIGLTEVPTITLKGLTERQKAAYVIADNQLALNAGWDFETLKDEVSTLLDTDFDVSLLGFDDDFFALLSNNETEMGLTPEEKLDNFLHGDTKILRLAYSEDELKEVVALLDRALLATGVDDYSTLVAQLLRDGAKNW